MDISILGSDSNNPFYVTTIKKCSGINQLIQTVISEFVRPEDTLRGVGSNGISILEAATEEEANAIAQDSVTTARTNIILNQRLNGSLTKTETLVDLSLIGNVSAISSGYEVSLRIVSAANEVRELVVPITN